MLDHDAMQIFERMFRQRAERARIADRLRSLKLEVQVREAELADADASLKSLDEQMSRLADRAAGLERIPDDEPARPQYAPIGRSGI